jgi:hypothetical protein
MITAQRLALFVTVLLSAGALACDKSGSVPPAELDAATPPKPSAGSVSSNDKVTDAGNAKR